MMRNSRLAGALLGAVVVASACADRTHDPIAPDPAFDVSSGRPFAPGSIVPGSIAFVSTRALGRSDLFAMNPDGSNVIQLTSSARDELLDNIQIEFNLNRPVWSPDGSKLLFTRRAWDLSVTPNTLIHDIHILDLNDPDPRAHRLMSNPAPSGTPTWSPDGQQVAYCSANAGQNEIWIYDIPSGAMTRTSSGRGCWPSWSPDGTRIAFHTGAPASRIAVLDLATGTVTFITSQDPTNIANDFFPRWSPDGEWIAFGSGRDKDANGTRYQAVHIVRSDGADTPRNLTPIPAGVAAAGWSNTQPVWSNNGNHIYFESLRPGSNGVQVFRMNRDGADLVSLTASPGAASQPDVRPIVRP